MVSLFSLTTNFKTYVFTVIYVFHSTVSVLMYLPLAQSGFGYVFQCKLDSSLSTSIRQFLYDCTITHLLKNNGFKVPFTYVSLIFLHHLRRLTFTVQNDLCVEFHTRRLFSHPSVEGGTFLFTHLKSDSNTCSHEQGCATSQIVWKSVMISITTCVMRCGNFKSPAQC